MKTHATMTRRTLIATATVAALPLGTATGAESFDALLGRYVAAGQDGVNRVRYAAWKASVADVAALKALISAQSAGPGAAAGRAAQFAFWANLYNAVTLDVVLDAYPVQSIRSIRSKGVGLDLKGLIGPWREKRVTVGGRRLSLDDIEHGILRPQFRDPRVHYAVNCASIGCPDLQPRAWRAETLDADLDAAARAYVRHPRGVAVEAEGLRLSSIFDWFAEDFGGLDGVRSHLARYAPNATIAEAARTQRVLGYRYDWSINAAKERG